MPTGTIVLISEAGGLLISGPDTVVTQDVGKKVSTLLQIRGGGKNGIFQGVIPPEKIKHALTQTGAIVDLLKNPE